MVSFVRYHLALGVSRIFLFVDGPLDESWSEQEWHPAVQVYCGPELRERWCEISSDVLPAIVAYRDHEVMARQLLNEAVALREARRQGLTWLLHLDADELFFVDSLQSHFRQLDAAGVTSCIYRNHEAVPESEQIADPFREVTLFKLNPAVCGGHPTSFFNCYTVGKPAVRVDAALMPTDVHSFPTARGTAWKVSFPCVLHYPNCGFEHFLAKYRALGNFSDKVFGYRRQGFQRFHLHARDVVMSGDVEAARAFFRSVVMLDTERRAECLRSGHVTRLAQPAALLGRQLEKDPALSPRINRAPRG